MEYPPHTVWLAEAVSAAAEHGAGTLLRIVLAVLLVGAALMGWFLLRGYRQDGRPEEADDAAGVERAPGGDHGESVAKEAGGGHGMPLSVKETSAEKGHTESGSPASR